MIQMYQKKNMASPPHLQFNPCRLIRMWSNIQN